MLKEPATGSAVPLGYFCPAASWASHQRLPGSKWPQGTAPHPPSLLNPCACVHAPGDITLVPQPLIHNPFSAHHQVLMPPFFWDDHTPKPAADLGQLSACRCCNSHLTGRAPPSLRTLLGARGIPVCCTLLHSPMPNPTLSCPTEPSTPTLGTAHDPML